MKRTLLKSKIHRATVTDANLLYQGSITIDPLLMEAADLVQLRAGGDLQLHQRRALRDLRHPGHAGAGRDRASTAPPPTRPAPGTWSSSPPTPTTRTRSAAPTSPRWSSWTPKTGSSPSRTSGSTRPCWRRRCEALRPRLLARRRLSWLLACAGAGGPAAGPGRPGPAKPVAFKTLVQRAIPGQAGEQIREVARDAATWNALWAELRERTAAERSPRSRRRSTSAARW